jgi:phosphate transport system permease protein
MTKNKIIDTLFKYFGLFCTLLGLFVLALLLWSILSKGFSRLSWDFISNLPSRFPEKSGIMTALAGMMSLVVLTVLISFPIGIGAGIYLEEYGVKNYWAQLIWSFS